MQMLTFFWACPPPKTREKEGVPLFAFIYFDNYFSYNQTN